MKNSSSIINRLMSRFSYSEKFVFISLMFALAILVLSSIMTYNEHKAISFVNDELNGINYLVPMRKLMDAIPKHKFLLHRYLAGNHSLKNDVVAAQFEITENLNILKLVDDAPGKQFTSTNQAHEDEEKEVSEQSLKTQWENIKNQSFNLTPEASDQFHDQLLASLSELGSQIGDMSKLHLDPELSSHYMMTTILSRLPEFKENLTQATTIGEDIIQQKKGTTEQLYKLNSLIGLLKTNMEGIKWSINKASAHNNEQPTINFRTLDPDLAQFIEATQDFINYLNNKLIYSKEVTTNEQEFLHYANAVSVACFKLFDNSLALFKEQLLLRKHDLRVQQFYGLGLATLLSLLAFGIGLFIMRQISIPLENLTEATRRLAAGDLSTRVKITYQDEIGKVGNAFNNMAESFETIIGQLRVLLEAIKRLASGDLSVRVSVTNPNEEIGKVGESFNSMAQSFEEIISQLHLLGINLTTSSTQIAEASREQEMIIMEQEAATREISLAAHQISSNAREFATTVSEVSLVAEETSGLAEKGRESLDFMETIMHQMDDASTTIASKLAILNEKASNITSVITTITKVADQTNLLSLNASIEAEKAGEFGRSFSVIAKEIRRLADQTAFATLDIEKIVNEIMKAVSSSVKGVDDFTQEIRAGVSQTSKLGEQLSMIIEQVQKLTDRFETVNQGMQTQSEGAGQINEAILQLTQTAQLTTESIHQFHATIEQLNGAANDLHSAVLKIKK